MIGIYKITNLMNNKVYIGQSVDIKSRISNHKWALKHNRHDNVYLQCSYNKYGKQSFEFSVICECNEDELDRLECYYIDLYHSIDRKYGYNMETGGNKNKHPSQDVIDRMKENRQGKNAPMSGKHHSEETKEKMRQSALGRTLSDDHKKKLSESHKGKLAKQVYCVELNMTFCGTLEAIQYVGLKSRSHIIDCIAGRKKSAGKHPTTGEPLHWMYLEDK